MKTIKSKRNNELHPKMNYTRMINSLFDKFCGDPYDEHYLFDSHQTMDIFLRIINGRRSNVKNAPSARYTMSDHPLAHILRNTLFFVFSVITDDVYHFCTVRIASASISQ